MGSPALPHRQLVTLKAATEVRSWLTERYGRRLIAERRLPYYKVGGRVLIDLHELDALVEASRVEPQRTAS